LIDTNVSDITEYTEIFETNVTAKVTVLCGDNSEHTWYLLNDRTTTDDEDDENRAVGDIEVIYEEETANAFSDNPFDDDEDYGKLYRTGDMVRILPDGSLGIVGRRDSQVKIRGNRVELSEVELVIRELDYVKDVTVQTIKNGANNEIIAYVEAIGEYDNNTLKHLISDYVSKRKPDYMIPSFVIKLESS